MDSQNIPRQDEESSRFAHIAPDRVFRYDVRVLSVTEQSLIAPANRLRDQWMEDAGLQLLRSYCVLRISS